MSTVQGYLEGCRIYLSGFSTVEQETLKKIINNGAGMRLDVLSARVTHIVTKVTNIKEVSQYMKCYAKQMVLRSLLYSSTIQYPIEKCILGKGS